MRVFAFLLILTYIVFAGNEGAIGQNFPFGDGIAPVSSDQAVRSSADWFDMKKLNGAVDTISVITPSTYWGNSHTYLIKAIYNNSGTDVVVRVATANNPSPSTNDTIRLKIQSYTCSPKLPSLSKIFKLGETDSLIVFVQVQ